MKIRIRDLNETTDGDKDLVMDWQDDSKLAIDFGHGRFETIFLDAKEDELTLTTASGTIKIDVKKMVQGWDVDKGCNPSDWIKIPRKEHLK